MSAESEAVVRRFVEECLNGRNPEVVDELFHPPEDRLSCLLRRCRYLNHMRSFWSNKDPTLQRRGEYAEGTLL